MAQRGKGVVREIFKNFIRSLKPRNTSGNLVGKDYYGTAYYEIPADPQGGKRKPRRWFKPPVHEKFDQEIPAEWEAWLRGRRQDPPTDSEIMRNLSIINMKKTNATLLEEKEAKLRNVYSEMVNETKSEFPTYEEYETIPGQKEGDNYNSR